MEKLQQARQAFQKEFGVTPETEEFCIIAEVGKKIVFARSDEALEAYKKAEKLTAKDGPITLGMMLGVTLIWVVFLWAGGFELRAGKLVFLVVTGLFLVSCLFFYAKRDKAYESLKKSWKGNLFLYSEGWKEFYEP